MHIVLRRSHPQQVKLRVSLRKTLQPGLSVKLSIAKISHDDATSTVAIVTATRSAIALATLVNTATKTESGMGSGIWATLNESNADQPALPLPHCGVNGSRFTHGQLQCGDRLVGRLDLTEEEHAELVDAANEGNAMGFIMRPVSASSHATRQLSGLKIHSNLYH